MLMKCWGVHMAFESPHILVQSMYDFFNVYGCFYDKSSYKYGFRWVRLMEIQASYRHRKDFL